MSGARGQLLNMQQQEQEEEEEQEEQEEEEETKGNLLCPSRLLLTCLRLALYIVRLTKYLEMAATLMYRLNSSSSSLRLK